MAIRLDTRSADFAQKFRAFLDTKRETAADVEAAVRTIVADVAARGDRALKDYTLKFDRLDLDRVGLKVTAEEIAAAQKACSRDVQRFCRPVIDQGDLTILSCLQQNRPKLTTACDQVLKDHGQ